LRHAHAPGACARYKITPIRDHRKIELATKFHAYSTNTKDKPRRQRAGPQPALPLVGHVGGERSPLIANGATPVEKINPVKSISQLGQRHRATETYRFAAYHVPRRAGEMLLRWGSGKPCKRPSIQAPAEPAKRDLRGNDLRCRPVAHTGLKKGRARSRRPGSKKICTSVLGPARAERGERGAGLVPVSAPSDGPRLSLPPDIPRPSRSKAKMSSPRSTEPLTLTKSASI